MYLVDASTLVAAFRLSEKSHEESLALLSTLRLSGFSITEHVLSEVATVLKFKEGKDIAKRATELLMLNDSIELLKLTTRELERTISFFLDQKKLSFVDASLVVMARERGYALVTQDKAMLEAFKFYKAQ